jgi:hypothetical protein
LHRPLDGDDRLPRKFGQEVEEARLGDALFQRDLRRPRAVSDDREGDAAEGPVVFEVTRDPNDLAVEFR